MNPLWAVLAVAGGFGVAYLVTSKSGDKSLIDRLLDQKLPGMPVSAGEINDAGTDVSIAIAGSDLAHNETVSDATHGVLDPIMDAGGAVLDAINPWSW